MGTRPPLRNCPTAVAEEPETGDDGLVILARTTIAVALAALVASGCGRSKPMHTHADDIPLTMGQAVADANAVNLNEADVPGWIREERGLRLKVTSRDVAAARCAGGVDPRRALIVAGSARYSKKDIGSLFSRVVVWPTAALAAQNTAAEGSDRSLECARREERRTRTAKFHGHLVRVVLKGIARLPDPLPTLPTSFAWRTTWTNHVSAYTVRTPAGSPVEIHATTYRAYEDEITLVAGPAEITLYAFGPLKPMSTATEQDALMTIYERAEARKL
jgi:hypothetical protein